MSAGELAKRGSEAGGLWDVAAGNADADEQRNMKGLTYIPLERCSTTWRSTTNFYELADIYALGLMIWEAMYMCDTARPCRAQAIMPECHEGQDVLIRISPDASAVRIFCRSRYGVPAQVLAREAVAEELQNMTVVLNEWENLRKLANSLTAVDPELHSQTSSTGGNAAPPRPRPSSTGRRSLATSVTTAGSTDTRSTLRRSIHCMPIWIQTSAASTLAR